MNPADRSLKSAAILSVNKPHGTRIKYLGGCHCLLCRAANSNYSTMRTAAQRTGDWNGIIPAGPSRKHLHALRTLGVGLRAVSAASDVSRTILADIRSGKRMHIRKRTETRILLVSIEAASDKALVDADPTWKLINELLGEGFTKAEIARRMGLNQPVLQFGRFEVTARTANRVERFYRSIMAGG